MNNERDYRSPIIRNVPENCERLIDAGMLHFESSVAGYNERYHKGETSHTIHVWWARRPHSAMRSLAFSSVCKDKDIEAEKVLADLAIRCDEESVEKAKNLVAAGYSNAPKVLDMFGGGGTIAFEAKRLGLEVYSIDSNQLAVFIQKCNMLYSDCIDLNKAVKLVEKIGEDVLKKLKERTDWLYPLREKMNEEVFGYVWTYREKCPYCGYRLIISKRPWLAKKKDRKIAFVGKTIENDKVETVEVKCINEDDQPFSSHWESRAGILRCPRCGQVIKNVDVLQCEDVMTAYIKKHKGVGKEYINANQDEAIPSLEIINQEEQALLIHLDEHLPSSKLPVWSGVVNPALYGIKTHSDFLNPRQRLYLLYLIDELISHFELLCIEDKNMAKFVIGSLSSLIDQVIDWNCRLSMWIPQNEQVGRGFCGPGIAMLFDYAETDQSLHGPANLWDKLKRIINGVKSFQNCCGEAHIEHMCAQQLSFENEFFDAIVTDPPYYDNIFYSILADFFYSWKKILLKRVEPDLFKNEVTDYSQELVASSHRVDDGQSAHEEYCLNLSRAFNEAARVLKQDGVFTLVYSHSSVNAWAAIIRAYRQSLFYITSVQPLSIERKGRPRAVLSQAVNTCMAIVARKSDEKKSPIDLDDILLRTEENCNNFGKMLIEQSGWTQSDAGLAVIACTVGMLANASSISDGTSDPDAILLAAKIVKGNFPEFSIKVRDSL